MASSHSGINVMKMKFVLGALALLFAAATTAHAAEEWGLPEEKIVRFEAE